MRPIGACGFCFSSPTTLAVSAHASYLIVVDPQQDVQQYLTNAGRLGAKIRHVFLTHFHTDFIAGHLELRDRCSVDIRLGARAQAEYSFVPMN